MLFRFFVLKYQSYLTLNVSENIHHDTLQSTVHKLLVHRFPFLTNAVIICCILGFLIPSVKILLSPNAVPEVMNYCCKAIHIAHQLMLCWKKRHALSWHGAGQATYLHPTFPYHTRFTAVYLKPLWKILSYALHNCYKEPQIGVLQLMLPTQFQARYTTLSNIIFNCCCFTHRWSTSIYLANAPHWNTTAFTTLDTINSHDRLFTQQLGICSTASFYIFIRRKKRPYTYSYKCIIPWKLVLI